MSPPELYTGTLHFTKNTHQDLGKVGIDKIWIIYLQVGNYWYEIDFHEEDIKSARNNRSGGKLGGKLGGNSMGNNGYISEFGYRELKYGPEIYTRCVDSDDGEAMITKRVREFGMIRESVGLRRLLREFGEMWRKLETPVDELFLPPLFLLWLESQNIKIPKTKKNKQKKKKIPTPDIPNPLSDEKREPKNPQPRTPDFKIDIKVEKNYQAAGNAQEQWIWTETSSELSRIKSRDANKSGLYIIPTPQISISPSFPSSSSSSDKYVLFAWVHENIITKNSISYAVGKCLHFPLTPSSQTLTPTPTVHLHPTSSSSKTPNKYFAASISLDAFDNSWEKCEVDVNKPAIPCRWWKNNIDIMNDGVLMREYEGLWRESREKGGPQFTSSTFLAKIFDKISVSQPTQKKRGKKNPAEKEDIDIEELYTRGRADIPRSRRHRYRLQALASSSTKSRNQNQSPRSKSMTPRRNDGEKPRSMSMGVGKEISDQNPQKDEDGREGEGKRGRSRSRSRSFLARNSARKHLPSRTHSLPPAANTNTNTNTENQTRSLSPGRNIYTQKRSTRSASPIPRHSRSPSEKPHCYTDTHTNTKTNTKTQNLHTEAHHSRSRSSISEKSTGDTKLKALGRTRDLFVELA